MGSLDFYRETIEKILSHYYQITVSQNRSEIEDRIAFDRIRDEYIWFCCGWDGIDRINRFVVYLTIKNNKVWIEEDNTDLCIVDELLDAGIPKTDIVLGFHHPSKRSLTEFATV